MTRRISDIAFQCWSNTLSDPKTALLVVKNGVYYDHYRAAEHRRARFRKFYKQNYDSKELTITQ